MTPFNRAARQAFTPLLTPFSENGIDLTALEAAVDRQIVAGMNGIVICDAIGEGHSLSGEEQDAVLRSCVSRAKTHLSVIIAAGTNSTRTTIERCRNAESLGADGLLVTVPYYSKPTLKGVIEHFRQIATSVSIPIIVDDDPGRTAIDHGPGLLEGLSQFDIIAGVCHGSGRIAHFARLPDWLRKRFLHLSRDDATMIQFLEMGGNGAISPIANVIPSPVQTLVATTESQVTPSRLAQTLNDAVAALERDDVAGLKEAAFFIHQQTADVRLPLVAAEPETVVRVRHAFASFAGSEVIEQVAA